MIVSDNKIIDEFRKELMAIENNPNFATGIEGKRALEKYRALSKKYNGIEQLQSLYLKLLYAQNEINELEMLTNEIIEKYNLNFYNTSNKYLFIIALYLSALIISKHKCSFKVSKMYLYVKEDKDRIFYNEVALERLYKAIKLCSEEIILSDFRELLPRIYDAMAFIYSKSGYFKIAAWFYEKSIGLKEYINDHIGLSITYSKIIKLYIDLHDFNIAEKYIKQKDFPLSNSLQQPIYLAYSNINLGYLTLESGDSLKAYQIYYNAYKTLESLEDSLISNRAKALSIVGCIEALYSECKEKEDSFSEKVNDLFLLLKNISKHEGSIKPFLEGYLNVVQARLMIEQKQDWKEICRLYEDTIITYWLSGDYLQLAKLLFEYSMVLDDFKSKLDLEDKQPLNNRITEILQYLIRIIECTDMDWFLKKLENHLSSKDRYRGLLIVFRRYIGRQTTELILETDFQKCKSERCPYFKECRGLKLCKNQGEIRNVSILFADIRNFTKLSEKLPSKEVITLINRYLNIMSNVIDNFGGWIDKYIGDAIMAIFSIPEEKERVEANNAVLAAIAMQRELQILNLQLKEENRDTLSIGIGIHHGEIITGIVGSKHRMSYTVIGDNVNIASRIESLTKYYGMGILLTGEVIKFIDPNFNIFFRKVDKVRLKGKEKPTSLYSVYKFGLPTLNSYEKWEFETNERAFQLFENREYIKAVELFSELREQARYIGLVDFYNLWIFRCGECIKTPPPEDWLPIYDIE